MSLSSMFTDVLDLSFSRKSPRLADFLSFLCGFQTSARRNPQRPWWRVSSSRGRLGTIVPRPPPGGGSYLNGVVEVTARIIKLAKIYTYFFQSTHEPWHFTMFLSFGSPLRVTGEAGKTYLQPPGSYRCSIRIFLNMTRKWRRVFSLSSRQLDGHSFLVAA